MRASRAAELDDSNPLGWVAFLKRHTDDPLWNTSGRPTSARTLLPPTAILAQRWPSTGSRTEAYNVVWTGRCDWDCDSVLARIARLGSFMDTDPASYGVAGLGEGLGKMAEGLRRYGALSLRHFRAGFIP